MERISLQELPEGLYRVMAQVESYVNHSGLDHKLLHLLRFRISQLNHCAYCLDMHAKEAIHHGETPLRLFSVAAWQEAPFYSDKEKIVLAFAEALTLLPDHHVDDEQYGRLQQFFSKEEIANLTLAVAQINSWNRLVQVIRPVPGNYQVREKSQPEAV